MGGDNTTPYKLAKITNPNVGKIPRPSNTPKNVTMDVNKMKNEFK